MRLVIDENRVVRVKASIELQGWLCEVVSLICSVITRKSFKRVYSTVSTVKHENFDLLLFN